jgi:DNA-binding response OmpR family regulator
MTDAPLVLLVDDDRDTREMYGLGLELQSLRLATAGSAAEALRLAEQLSPHVIVTDLTLPDADGLELCGLLRSGARTHAIPVIALTGRSDGDQVSLATQAGARRVVLKPCTPEELATVIRDVLAEG